MQVVETADSVRDSFKELLQLTGKVSTAPAASCLVTELSACSIFNEASRLRRSAGGSASTA